MMSGTALTKICDTLTEINEPTFVKLFKIAYGIPEQRTDNPLYSDVYIKALYTSLRHAAQSKGMWTFLSGLMLKW